MTVPSRPPAARPRRPRRLVLAGVLLLVAVPAAEAAVDGVSLVVPEYTRASPDAGIVRATFRWAPPVFTPVSGRVDRVEFQSMIIPGGGGGASQGSPPFNQAGIGVADGSQLVVTLWGCQLPTGSAGVFCHEALGAPRRQSSAVTRLDGTPPTATMTINAGAAFTDRREVSLDVTASDPPIGTIPNSSSGVTEHAIDTDGDGTYPCSILIGAVDLSGCARPFAPRIPFTLPDGDGPKTVGVMVGDGARDVIVPCTGRFCIRLLGSPIAGNASPPATDSIVLDTTPPVAQPVVSATAVPAGGSVSFDAGLSSDPNPAVASGIDPAATTWDLGDGSVSSGPAVTHVYAVGGTFTGSVIVRDRAGNASAPAPFTVTVTAPPAAGAAAVPRARFRLAALTRAIRVVRGRLAGSLTLRGTSAGGVVRVTLRRLPSGPVRVVSRRTAAGPFRVTVRLPAGLRPGRYRIRVLAPGGAVVRDLRAVLGVRR